MTRIILERILSSHLCTSIAKSCNESDVTIPVCYSVVNMNPNEALYGICRYCGVASSNHEHTEAANVVSILFKLKCRTTFYAISEKVTVPVTVPVMAAHANILFT